MTTAANAGVLSACAFAVQRAVEYTDALISLRFDLSASGHERIKKAVLLLAALLYASVLTKVAGLDITNMGDAWPWRIVTAFALSAGVEGVNSVLKGLGYAKDQVNPKK
jgi:hypothetical protein